MSRLDICSMNMCQSFNTIHLFTYSICIDIDYFDHSLPDAHLDMN